MHKPKWRAKAIHIIFAFALVFGLSAALVPTSPAAEASIPGEATFTIVSGELTLEAGGDIYGQYVGTNNGIPEGPYYAEMTIDIVAIAQDETVFEFEGEFWAKAWVSATQIDFYGQSNWAGPATIVTLDGGLLTIDPDGAITIHETGSIPDTQESWSATYEGLIGIPELMPDLAMDVKGSVQKFVLLNVPMYTEGQESEWEYHAGMMEQDFRQMIVDKGLEAALSNLQGLWVPQIAHCEEGPLSEETDVDENWRDAWKILPGVNLDATDIHVIEGGDSSIPHLYQSHPYIEVEAAAPGDAFFSVYMWWVGPGGGDEILIQLEPVEKKWGVISDSTLDVDPVADGVQHEELVHLTLRSDGSIVPKQEVITEMVYANFMWGELYEWQEYAAGHAIVHWWLFDNTDETQAYIHDLMDYLEAGNDTWTAVGDYDPIPDFGEALSTSADTPFEYIDLLLTLDLDSSGDNDAADTTEWKDEVGGTPSGEVYIQTVTEDDFPGETRGMAQAELHATDAEKVMIVTMAEYPINYHGENPIAVQMGKKEFTVTPIVQVKTPQLRWAGEKIVLEKDWGVGTPNGRHDDLKYIAIYWLEEGSIGNLEAIVDEYFFFGWDPPNLGAQQVIVELDDDGISRVILSTEQQGEADVNAALYEIDEGWIGGHVWGPINNHGFLVYFLAFEDVVLAEGVPLDLVALAGEQIDVTPQDGLERLDPGVDGDDAEVAVQVRGWFTSDALPGTSRPPIDLDGDGVYEMPRGRYVLPNDWPALAEYNYGLRPSWDMMDEAHLDGIVSPIDLNDDHAEELGPYDIAVRTTTPPDMAQWPNIGPFNTLQPWSVEDMWVATATVPADYTVGPPTVRNTVVPDGFLTWLDAPMPQALVIFDIVAESEDAMLSTLDKGDLEGYGYVGAPKVYQSPFYAVEIPASPFIPAGYNWDSWGVNTSGTILDDGPYDYWMDLELLSINANTLEDPINPLDVEVFSDNHGIAAMCIGALEQAGSVTIEATAEYPYAPKKGKYGPRTSDEITAQWGAFELNPHFGVDKTEVEVGETVTFTNLTAGGTLPYVTADWDWGDGTTHGTTAVNADETIPHVYNTPGLYSVILTMTDSTPTTRWEERPDYITVIPVVDGEDILAYYRAFSGDPGVVDTQDLLKAADDWANDVVPPNGFTEPITTQQLLALADEWAATE